MGHGVSASKFDTHALAIVLICTKRLANILPKRDEDAS